MRSLSKDRQRVWFSRKSESQDGIDTIEVYEKPIKKRMSVSATSGDPTELSSGIVPDYDKTILSYDKKFSVQEGDVAFVDVIPELDEDGNLVMDEDGITPKTKPDYIIKRIETSQKSITVRYRIVKIGGNKS